MNNMSVGFNLPQALDCAKSFYESTGIACSLTKESGEVLCEHGYGYPSCRVCGLAGHSKAGCFQAQMDGLDASQSFGGKYLFYCPLGLGCLVVPILGADGGRAQITAGPFLMVPYEDYIENDLHLMRGVERPGLDLAAEEVRKIPIIDPGRISSYSTLLSMAVGFLNSFSTNLALARQEEAERLNKKLSSRIGEMKNEAMIRYPAEEVEILVQALSSRDVRLADSSLERIFAYYFYVSTNDISAIKIWGGHLLGLVLHTAGKEGVAREVIFRAEKDYRARSFASKEDVLLCLAETVHSIIDQIPSARPAPGGFCFNDLKNYIRENCQRNPSLEDLARLVNLSPAHLSAKFRRLEGRTLVDYANMARIEKAKELLSREDIPISRITQMVGIGDQSYFSRLFRRYASTTPAAYRRALRAKVGSNPEIHQEEGASGS